MKKITRKTDRKRLAAIIVEKLAQHKIEAVLVGGAVVSLYTDNKYESLDLDFISSAEHKRIVKAMSELGFVAKGKDFVHPDTSFTVEFPTGPLYLGEDTNVIAEGKMVVNGITITMLSPTQTVMDRLAWFFNSHDRQCLDQAVWVASEHPIDMQQLIAWAQRERQEEKFQVFLNRIGFEQGP